MNVRVQFFSLLRDLTGVAECSQEVPAGGTVARLMESLALRFPRLREAERCALVAVGVEYAPQDQELHEGDLVSLFPPVQGG
jgi:molybdopterin converting factor small subunit